MSIICIAKGTATIGMTTRGAEDADELMADIMLACMALHHVAEFATDKCRFVPLPGKNGG